MQFYHSRARDSDPRRESRDVFREIAHRYTFGIAYVTLSIAKVYLDVISERIPARSHQANRATRASRKERFSYSLGVPN